MGCCTDREKNVEVKAEQKWEYINLDDFKCNSCWVPFTYAVLWINLFISVSVYCVDTFTAVNLLAFDRWSGLIKPEIPLSISRWIFAGCIILSFVLLFFRWLRAIRVMKASGVAQSYLDPLAIRIQSVRMGKEGRGWKRFLVFAELTKSKKGADYVALFTYYSFEAWLRIIFAEGPRQVVNAMTLYSVMRLNLIPQGKHAATDGHSPIVQFFVNIGVLADSNKEQVVILFGMLWTLLIWLISAISLAMSVILYLLFLFHHIPSEDGSLSKYCRRKINRRMERIIKVKVDKALKKENELLARQEAREGKDVKRQPTIPVLEPDLEGMTPGGLSRQTTQATLPEYSSRQGSDRSSEDSYKRQPTLPDVDFANERPLPPSRAYTHSSQKSWQSQRSNAPLMGDAASMGYGQPGRVQTPVSATTASGWGSRPPPNRSMTGTTMSSERSYTPGYRATPGSAQDDRQIPGSYQMEPLPRPGTAMSGRSQRGQGPSPIDSHRRQSPPTSNPYFPSAENADHIMAVEPDSYMSPTESQGRRTPAPPYDPYFPPHQGPVRQNYASQPPNPSQIPATSIPPRSFTPGGSRSTTPGRRWPGPDERLPTLPRLQTSQITSNTGYTAYSPHTASTTPSLSGPPRGPYRSNTQPDISTGTANYSVPGRQMPQYSQPPQSYPRSATAPPGAQKKQNQDSVTDDIMDSY